ncbi:LAMI_0H10330g1_1 [Lachancea mirantina]|uniref:LAMI_0H10330g1_1 n=1 Tax=Lachancea mirantina TaxID=1230905 RepID=A0A1G4KGK5_9SACH|nr:LAMI_0H10330g1_1 [Lachancea mirantina]
MASESKRKRNRVPLSCTICRKRKVKCDKTRPHCQQCVKTGVAHLCHYMEQTWAEEAEKELSKESELKQLRERVKSLEESLSKIHSASNNTPDSNVALSDEPKLVQQNIHDNDELDLTRQFDMLHLKNNGTVHLGATHWLAIMKGDPYLKLLWAHIFTLREKLAEWYMHKKKVPRSGVGVGKCPVIHAGSRPSITAPKPESGDGRHGKCPVDHHALMQAQHAGSTDLSSRTNMMHMMPSDKRPSLPSVGCPVRHDSPLGRSSPVQTQPLQCPVAHGNNPHVDLNNTKPNSAVTSTCPALPPRTSLPSFGTLTSRCPVIHDSTPPPAALPNNKNQTEKSMSEEQAIKRICTLLPPKKIIALLLDRFFKFIYPVIPILDEQSFKNQIGQMLQNKDETLFIKLTKPSDCCLLGIMVIIIRLTWLSLPQNACDVDLGPQSVRFLIPHVTTSTMAQSKEDQLLLNFETPPEAVYLTRKFLIRFDEISSFSNSNVNLTTVQFALFYKLYLMCCPDGPHDSSIGLTSSSQDSETHQMLLSSVVQMAFSCGLHRDPDNFPQLTVNTDGKLNKEAHANTERLKHTWRKTWYFIVSLDVQQSLSLGAPRLLRNLKDFSDTKLPCTSKIDYVRNIKELVVVKNFTLFFQLDLCIIAVLNHILNVSMSKTVRKYELDSLIEILKQLCFGDGNVNEVLTKLINSGLLFTTEGSVDQGGDEFYPLPSLEKTLSPPPPSESEKDKKLNLPHEMATRAIFFSKHLTLRMLLYLLNYILFTHYEPKGNEDPGTRPLAKEYAQEALNYAMDGFRNCHLFFANSKVAEGGNTSIFNYMEVALAPHCLDVGHRTLQFMVCLILRAKCGPLTGMGDSPIISSAGNSSSEEEPDNKNQQANTTKKKTVEVADITDDIDLEIGDELAEILMTRMTLFHKLTKQVSVKYHYAKRMMRSTGFFIALLRNPGGKNSSENKISDSVQKSLPKFQHPSISRMSGLFKNVPSLVLSADGEQLKRCPVYQDAIGFLPSRLSVNFLTKPQTQESPAQLPPIRTYQPITYTSNDIRRTSDVRDSDVKRRRLGSYSPAPLDPISADSRSPEPHGNFSPVPIPSTNPSVLSQPEMFVRNEVLPPFDKLSNTLSPTGSARAADTSSAVHFALDSPSILSDVSSSAKYTPDFEDFLMQNSNFNGLIINPTSIVEAVGFDNYNEQISDTSPGMRPDFLPIDNPEIDGLADIAGNNGADFLWD